MIEDGIWPESNPGRLWESCGVRKMDFSCKVAPNQSSQFLDGHEIIEVFNIS